MWNVLIGIGLAFLALVVVYVLYMSRHNNVLKKYGFEGGKVYPVMGNTTFEPFLKQVVDKYKQYKDQKVWANYGPGMCSIIVSDLDMVKEIFTKSFNNFPDRRPQPKLGLTIDHMLTILTGEQWKHVRSTLSPSFSSGKLKRMSKNVERTAQVLVENFTQKMERNEPVEMKTIMSCFSMDVIANSGFGIDLNSLNDPENPFSKAGKKLLSGIMFAFALFVFFPFMVPVLRTLGIYAMHKPSLDFFSSFVDKAMAERRSDEQGNEEKRNDFLQLIVDAEKGNQNAAESKGDNESSPASSALRGLTRDEIQGSALVFLLGSYDTISSAMSFAFFLIASHPEALKKVQEEIDEKLGTDVPNYDNVSGLAYLEMCMNESLRLFPPIFILERYCTQATTVNGVHLPQGFPINIPIYAIQRDPEIWEEPDEFKPERFGPEQKDVRHPYSFLPFGQGPRNCIGMRLAQLEMKIALAAVLQKLTPVACEKTVFPIQLQAMRMESKDGLWLKMEKREK